MQAARTDKYPTFISSPAWILCHSVKAEILYIYKCTATNDKLLKRFFRFRKRSSKYKIGPEPTPSTVLRTVIEEETVNTPDFEAGRKLIFLSSYMYVVVYGFHPCHFLYVYHETIMLSPIMEVPYSDVRSY